MMKLFKLFLFCIFFLSQNVFAGFISNFTFNYQSETSKTPDFEFSSIKIHGLFGSMLGKKENLIIGTNFIYQINSNKTSTDNSYNSLEFGPKIMYFFGDSKSFGIGGGYNLYLKGSRKVTSNEDLLGTSIIGTITYQLKIIKKVYTGFSLNYHSVSLSKVSTTSAISSSSDTYTHIYPGIEISIRL